MNYALHILIMINIYVILGLSLNLLVGYTGLISLCHAAFYGIGAYISTLLTTELGCPYLIALPASVAGAMFLSFAISIPSLRLKGDYFILGTFAFQVIVFSVLYNWIGLTRGPYGIPGIARPRLFGLHIQSLPHLWAFSFFLALLCLMLLWLLGHSPFGRVLKAIREDEIAAQAMGKNVARFKVKAFIIAAGVAAVAGSLFAHYVTYIDPTSFTLEESIFIISIVVIGGAGNIKGPVIGAFLLVLIPEVLRFLSIPDSIAPNVRQMIYGLLLIVFMRFRPQGILGDYRFE